VKVPALLLALAAALPAHAQVYKCTDGARVTYSEAPCERGAQAVLRPATPPPDPGAAAELQRMRNEAAQLQAARETREARQERQDAAHDRQAARRREQCARLELARKWADEDVRRAPHQSVEAARLKARRAAERHAAACP
jgi:Domain of unknown function (DUF4124)